MRYAIDITMMLAAFIGTITALGGKDKDTRRNGLFIALAAIFALVLIGV